MEKDKTHWKKNFNYNYLGAYSLKPGQEATLTITEVNKELVVGANGQKDDCTIAYFKEAVNGENKPMILNKTNCKVIEKIYGTPFIEEWKGKKVTIFVQNNIKAFGDLIDALRIKELMPTTVKHELTPKSDKWKAAQEKVKTGEADFDSLNKHYIITDKNYKILCS